MTAPVAPATTAGVWRGILVEYADRMPIGPDTPIVTLREGGTPLIHSEELSDRTGCEVHLKYDGANPTGSFKDRGMTMAVTRAVEDGSRAIICASTGNTSAAAAAYAARAGITASLSTARSAGCVPVRRATCSRIATWRASSSISTAPPFTP